MAYKKVCLMREYVNIQCRRLWMSEIYLRQQKIYMSERKIQHTYRGFYHRNLLHTYVHVFNMEDISFSLFFCSAFSSFSKLTNNAEGLSAVKHTFRQNFKISKNVSVNSLNV